MKGTIAAATVIMIAGLAFSQTIPTEGLAAHWDFDDNMLDQSGNGLDGTFHGGTPSYVDGVVGRALSFDGIDDVVITDNPFPGYNGSQGFSGVVWFKTFALRGMIWERMYHNFDLYIAESSDRALHGRTWRSDSNMTIKCPTNPCHNTRLGCFFPTIGVWYQAASVYDPSVQSLRLYVNGEAKGSTHIPVFTDFHHTTSNLQFGIGARPATHILPFHGVVDELIVYNRPLTVQEITDLYNGSAQAKHNLPRVRRAPEPSFLCSTEGVAIRTDREVTLTLVRPNGTSMGRISLGADGTHLMRKGLASGVYLVKYQYDDVSSVKRGVVP